MPVGVIDEGMRLLAPATKLMYQLIELTQSALDDADDVSCDADVVTDMLRRLVELLQRCGLVTRISVETTTPSLLKPNTGAYWRKTSEL